MNEFWKWIKGEKVLFFAQFTIWSTAIAALLEFIIRLNETSEIFRNINNDKFRIILINVNFYIQIIFITLVVLYFDFFHKNKNFRTDRISEYYFRLKNEKLSEVLSNKLKKLATINIQIFLFWWRIFWISLLLFYSIELISGLESVMKYKSNVNNKENVEFCIMIKRIAAIFFNNLGAVALFICFLILHSPIRSQNSFLLEPVNMKHQRGELKSNIYRLLFYLLIITVIHAASLFEVFNISKGENLFSQIERYDFIFRLISGLANCVILSLLIGRLDSKFIHTPSFLISILYIYAAVQIGFLFFNKNELKIYVIYLALFFKFYLFLILTFIIRTSRLSDMFMIFPYVDLLVEKTWQETSDKELLKMN
jgi:hypothetical protein